METSCNHVVTNRASIIFTILLDDVNRNDAAIPNSSHHHSLETTLIKRYKTRLE